ncbi:hypothetical protein GCM10010492_01090 [Saccharothrix mutabilis subsp. mutabilis]|uniref:Uncharacterized protein n=1 Tax=Saccharothrix mutabilis subsp. mutabilis TaxID=66855 RepID=A0ABP3CJC0_9PSEU
METGAGGRVRISMSFTNHARRARDTTLPYADRVGALRSCASLYKPFGFLATLGHLRTLAGEFERDEDALLRALVAVEASRRSKPAGGRGTRRSSVTRPGGVRRSAGARGSRPTRARTARPGGTPDLPLPALAPLPPACPRAFACLRLPPRLTCLCACSRACWQDRRRRLRPA